MKAENRITIGPNTKVKVLLDANQANVIEALVKLNKNFSKLRSPILRNLLARRVTIAEACNVANCKIDDFLKSMVKIGFNANFNPADVLVTDAPSCKQQANTPSIDSGPEEIAVFNAVKNRFAANKIKYIDVRYLEMPAPLLLILQHIDTLPKDQVLYIYHKRIPLLLLPELEESGFAYHFNSSSNTGVDMLIYRQ